jgi:hypothetical protein
MNATWKSVLFAAAMLHLPACSKKKAQTTPTNTAQPADAATTAPEPGMDPTNEDQNGDPSTDPEIPTE